MADINFLDSVFKALPTPSLVLLPDFPKFTIVTANDAYLEVVQTSLEELNGKGFFDSFPNHPNLKTDSWQNLLTQVVSGKMSNKTPVFDFPVRLKNTSEVQIRKLISSNTPVFDENNEVQFIIRSVTDVTELVKIEQTEKKSAESLLVKEKFLSETQRIAKVGSWEADLQKRILIWSEVAREIHEVEDSVCHMDFESVSRFYNRGSDWKRLTHVIREAIQLGKLFDLEVQMITAKDNFRWMRVTGIAELQDGKCVRMYGSIQDISDRKFIEQELVQSRNRFESLIQTVDGIVWETSAITHEFTFVSDQVKSILGFTAEEWMSEPDFWENHMHPDDRQIAVDYCYIKSKFAENYDFDYRMFNASGDVVWIKDLVSVITDKGKPIFLRGVMLDITESKRFSELERLEKSVLELNSSKKSNLQEVLTTYLIGIENIFPRMLCSILQVRNNRLYNWSSPSLPGEYTNSIEGRIIGEKMGSCGTAAFLKEKVIASDIEHDKNWADFKHLALPFNLRACWSHPVVDLQGNVLATFGIYYNEVKFPEEEELKTIERFTAILKIIIENRLNSELLEENTFLMKQGQELAHFGNWQWDIINDSVVWSDTLYAIYGLERTSFKATFAGYQELLYPEDRKHVVDKIQSVFYSRNDVVFEERIVRPGGEIRHLKSWARLKVDEAGVPLKMIGACLDITESKKAQEELLTRESQLRVLVDALKQSNERYEYVNKATRDAIYDWDRVKDHIAWGDGFSRLFGYEISEEKYSMGKWMDLINPLHTECVRNSLTQVLENRTQHYWTSEYQFEKSDGSYAFVQETGYIIRDDQGEAIRMIGVLKDISQRKKTQLKLLRKSRLLAAIAEVNSCLLQYDNWFSAMNYSFSIVGEAVSADRVYYFENFTDPKSGDIYCNQRIEWNSGKFFPQVDNPKLQNVPHKTLVDLVRPLSNNEAFSILVSKLPDSDFRSDLLEQEIKSMLIFPVFVKSKFYGYIGFDDCQKERKWDEDEISFLKTIAVNLAKAIETEEADKALLIAFEEKNKTLESIRDGFFAVSKDWIVTYWNKEAENLTGINRDDIVGGSLWKTYYKTIPSRLYNNYLKAFDENTPVRFEEHSVRLDKWFEVNAFPTDAGLTVYFKDITERKRGEEKLREMHKELEKNLKVLAISNSELEQFAYVASHDLQEPLRMVTSFLTLLEKKYGESLDEKAKVYIHYAVDGAKRMRQIILDLLDFSRVGKTEEMRSEINIKEIIDEIILLYQKNIKSRKAKIEISEMPTIISFETPVRQIFQNLISNALKYQPKGHGPVIKIKSVENSEYWEFSVADNGIGIDEQYLDKIFIIFQRLHNREEYSGTGMGLAITRKIVENLGGKIWVESKEGVGSTFYFTIAKQQKDAL